MLHPQFWKSTVILIWQYDCSLKGVHYWSLQYELAGDGATYWLKSIALHIVLSKVWNFAHVGRLRLLVVGSWVVGALVGTFGHESQESIHSRCFLKHESQESVHTRCFKNMSRKSRFIVVVFKNMSRKSRFRVVVFPNESRLVSRMNCFLPRAQKQNKTFSVLFLFYSPPWTINFYDPKIPICIGWANNGITSSADLSQILQPKIQISLGKKYREEVLVAPDTWHMNQRCHGGGRKRLPIARPSVRQPTKQRRLCQ